MLVAVWLSGNKVSLHQAGLVLRWVTFLLFNQANQTNSACHLSIGRCNEYISMVTATAREETASAV